MSTRFENINQKRSLIPRPITPRTVEKRPFSETLTTSVSNGSVADKENPLHTPSSKCQKITVGSKNCKFQSNRNASERVIIKKTITQKNMMNDRPSNRKVSLYGNLSTPLVRNRTLEETAMNFSKTLVKRACYTENLNVSNSNVQRSSMHLSVYERKSTSTGFGSKPTLSTKTVETSAEIKIKNHKVSLYGNSSTPLARKRTVEETATNFSKALVRRTCSKENLTVSNNIQTSSTHLSVYERKSTSTGFVSKATPSTKTVETSRERRIKVTVTDVNNVTTSLTPLLVNKPVLTTTTNATKRKISSPKMDSNQISSNLKQCPNLKPVFFQPTKPKRLFQRQENPGSQVSNVSSLCNFEFGQTEPSKKKLLYMTTVPESGQHQEKTFASSSSVLQNSSMNKDLGQGLALECSSSSSVEEAAIERFKKACDNYFRIQEFIDRMCESAVDTILENRKV